MRAYVFVVLTLVLILVLAWHFRRQDGASHGPVVAGGDATPAALHRPAKAPVTAPASTPAVARLVPGTLPSITAPPAETIGLLLPAARAGDARAACRLGIEYATCEALQAHGDVLIERLAYEEQVAELGDPQLDRIVRLAQSQARLLERRRDCQLLPENLRSDGTDWLARAAATGHAEASYRYLRGESMGVLDAVEPPHEHRLAFLGHPNARAWSRDAQAIAMRRIEAGDPRALLLMATARRSGTSPFDGLVPDDPVEAAALDTIVGNLWGARTDRLLEGLSQDQRSRVMARVAALGPRFVDAPKDNRVLARSALSGVSLLMSELPADYLDQVCDH